MRKKHKYSFKTRGRMFVIFLFFGAIIGTLGYTFVYNLSQIASISKEKKELSAKMVELEDEEEAKKADIKKLSDPTYIARYAREKYFYSKEGELIFRFME